MANTAGMVCAALAVWSRHDRRHSTMRPLRLLLGLALLLLAAHGAAWLWTTRQLDAGFAQWTDAMRTQGWTVAAGAPVRGGWPLAADLVVPTMSLDGGGLSWSGDAVRLRIAPLAPGTLQIRPEGVQRLRLAGMPEVQVVADTMLGLVPLDAPDTADLSATGVRAATAWGELAVAALNGRTTPLSATMEASGIGAPAGSGGAEASFDAALSEPVPPGRSAARRARQWRDAGGTLTIRQMAVRWGEFRAEGSGMGRLDASLQPQAEASLRLTGYGMALRALGEAGLVSASGAMAANAVLGLMARPSGGTVDVPLVLQDGVIRMGQIPLLRLPPLSWPPP